MYQRASQNAVALSLYQAVLTDSRTPPDIFEKALYQVAETLLRQFDYFPSEETYKIHPPVSVKTDIQLPNTIPNLKGCESRYSYVNIFDSSIASETDENYKRRREQYEIERDNSPDYIRCVGHDEQTQALLGKIEFSVSRDYQNRIDSIIAELQTKFPQSPNIDDLLFSNFYLSGRESKYLQQILTQYLDGERAAEAKFVLDKQVKEQSSPKSDDLTEEEKESLESGQNGPKVIALQKSLQAAGYYEAPTTGYYGEKTQLTVRKFQRKNGLEVSGSANADTLAVLQRLAPSK